REVFASELELPDTIRVKHLFNGCTLRTDGFGSDKDNQIRELRILAVGPEEPAQQRHRAQYRYFAHPGRALGSEQPADTHRKPVLERNGCGRATGGDDRNGSAAGATERR